MARTVRRRAERHTDVVVVGSPGLAVAEEDRESVADLLADLLVSAIERDEGRAR